MDPTPDYMALVHRAWKRGGSTSFQVFPIFLAEQLPCIPVPLRENQAEVLLDMQFVFNRVYDRGPYRRGAVDYARPPSVSLDNDRMDWAKSCVQAWLHGIV